MSTYATPEAETFGLRNGPHVNLVLEDVELPADHLIGEEGKGLRQAMVTLSNSRTLAGASAWASRAPRSTAPRRSRPSARCSASRSWSSRGSSGTCRGAGQVDAARLLTYEAARDLDEGREIARSSAAKLLAT